jgi:hypothetical protein
MTENYLSRDELILKFWQEAIDFALRERAKTAQAEQTTAEAIETQPVQPLPQSQPMPIEIVAIKRPQPTAQSAAESTDKKTGSQSENLNRQLNSTQSSPTIKPATVTSATNTSKAKKQVKSAQSKPASKLSDFVTTPNQLTNQSLGLFVGYLGIEGENLQFICTDGTPLPITGINQHLALRLMSHPSEMFCTEDSSWLVHPRADFRTKQLAIRLHGKLRPDEAFSIEPDHAIVRGKLVAVEEDKLIVTIRRNISREAFQELQRKGMIRGSEFEQFTVIVHGLALVEVGQMVELNCRRECDRLVSVE